MKGVSIMENRHTTANKLFPKLTDYWGLRVKSQLVYLEELNRVKNLGLDSLIDTAIEMTFKRYERDGTITKQSALDVEREMLPASKAAKAVTVSCIGHAHIDMNWMWRFDETVILTVDTFRTMLALMREYPSFTFAQSQASVYKIIEDYAPELLPEIRERIKEGRWEVTASTWVETDKNMPNGESLTRHMLYTRRYLKELLNLSDDIVIDFEPDTFGHSANVPEIHRTGGVKYMYHCRGYSGHNLYRWRAPSGATTTVYRDRTWYNDTITPEAFLYVPELCAKYNIDRMIHVYGVGDHGGGVTRRDIERLLDYSTWPCMPTITFGRFIDFFRYLDTLDHLPVVEQELNFVFDGCYTSQSRIKTANRTGEAALYDAEFCNSISHMIDAYEYNSGAFSESWKNVLFNHFHDIIPGSGVIDTREYAMGLFQRTMAAAGTRLSASVRAISHKINTAALLPASLPQKDSEAEGAGVGFDVDTWANSAISCSSFNNSGFKYTSSNTAGGAKRLFNLFNTTQTLMEAASKLIVWDWDGDRTNLKITNEAGDALDYELIDKDPQHFWGHSFFRVLVACPIPPFGYRTILLEENVEFRAPIIIDHERTEGAQSWILENEHVKAVFSPQTAALVSFTDKKSGQEYINEAGGASFRYIAEDGSRGMTSWRTGRHTDDKPPVGQMTMTPVTGSVNRSFTYEVTIEKSRMSVTVSLDKNARHIKYDVKCDWREFGVPGKVTPKLVFRAPLNYECENFCYDNAFGVIKRESLDHDVPALSFAFAQRYGCNDGLMLSSNSKYGFRCVNNTMALSLIRSSTDPDPSPEIYIHTFNINLGIVTDAVPRKLIETSLSYNRAAIVVPCESQYGELPLTGSFLRLIDGEAVISAVKMSEDGKDTFIIRCYDVSGAGNTATLELIKPVKSATYVDAHENDLLIEDKPVINDNCISIRLEHCSVTAVKIEVRS